MKPMADCFKKAIELWGIESQLGMLQEECAEAIQAVNKLRRINFGQPLRVSMLPDEAIGVLMEEVADVMLVCKQIKTCYPKYFKKSYLKKYNKFKNTIKRAEEVKSNG